MVRRPLKAVDFAADLASKYNAELILSTVAPHALPNLDPAVEQYGRLEHVRVPAAELAVTAADSVLYNARRTAQAGGATRISVAPSFGDPAQEILTAAQDWQSVPERNRRSRDRNYCRCGNPQDS